MTEKEEESKKVSRRRFLKYGAAAAVVAAVAAGGAYYAMTPPPTTPTAPSMTSSTAAATMPATTAAGGPAPIGSVNLAVWGYHPEIVQKSIAHWGQDYNDQASMSVVAGDWESSMETRFIAGIPIDVCYANPFHAIRWYKAGWIQNLESIQTASNIPYDISAVKSALYEGVRASWTATDGTLLALPYFTSNRGNLAANDQMLDKLGLSGEYPQTWSDLYDQIAKIQAKGVATPFLPHWFAEWFGACWGWLFEVANRATNGNDAMFDSKTFEATFDTNTLAAEVLTDWVNLWKAGAVPKGVLTMSESDFIAAYATGRYAYSPQQTYDIIGTFNTPSICPIAGSVSLVPATKQPWGLLDEGGYVLTSNRTRPRSDQDLKRAESLETFMGYKDKEGTYFVAKQWAEVSFLNSGYPDILKDPDVISAYTTQLGANRVNTFFSNMNSLYNVIQQPAVWKTFWYTDWQTQVNQTLPNVLTGKTTVNDAITTLRQSALNLLKQYPTT
jgi:ABC-type glycerol-3-phosphate transport system substrate-binding protein